MPLTGWIINNRDLMLSFGSWKSEIKVPTWSHFWFIASEKRSQGHAQCNPWVGAAFQELLIPCFGREGKFWR